MGVDQGLALSPILSALYLSSVLYVFEKQLKNLKISISFLFFVDYGLFITQNKSLSVSNSFLFCSYQIILSLLKKFGLKLEYSKTKIFHFLHSIGPFNLPPLNLSPLNCPILQPRNTWKYFWFIFDRKLSFWSHINFYTNKAISMVKSMKLLRNSTHGLAPQQKCLYIEVAFSLLLYMAISYGFTIKLLSHIPLESSTKYNTMQQYGYLVLFECLCYLILRLSQTLYLSNFISESSVTDPSSELTLFLQIILSGHYWTAHHPLLLLLILFCWCTSNPNSDKKSRITL